MIRVLPSEIAAKLAPQKTVKRLVKTNLTVNRAAVTMLAKTGFLSKKKLETVAIKVIRTYKEKYKEELGRGKSKTAARKEAIQNKNLMVSRVQNAAVFEITKEVKNAYRGEYYRWLPSAAKEPDPVHQLNYGKKFMLGRGEAPGDRFGCQCGMEILVDETKLNLERKKL